LYYPALIILKFARNIKRAVFVRAYSKAVERSNMKVSKSLFVEAKAHSERSVPFYNWLNERDSLS